jgi:hypothetical protein
MVLLSATSLQHILQVHTPRTLAAPVELVAAILQGDVEVGVVDVIAGVAVMVTQPHNATNGMVPAHRIPTGRLKTTMRTTRIKIQKIGITSIAIILGRTVVGRTLVFGIRLLAQTESGLPASANLLELSNQSILRITHRSLLRVVPVQRDTIPHRIHLVNTHLP